MNKITTLSEYKLHKNKLNRESYHKRKALVKNVYNINVKMNRMDYLLHYY